jgi:hypothetical protein
MSKHEKQDDKDKYIRNGYKPGPIPAEDPGGKHTKPEEKDNQDDKGQGT